jgi:hypothetical protein
MAAEAGAERNRRSEASVNSPGRVVTVTEKPRLRPIARTAATAAGIDAWWKPSVRVNTSTR